MINYVENENIFAEDKKERKNHGGATVATAREGMEAKIGIEAFRRAGHSKNLKGVVHEVMAKDCYNANPKRILDGTKAQLTKSTTAVRDDIVIMKDGSVVGRWQLKDTAKSINQTIRQVKDGHYAGTMLKGTEETAKAYGEAVKNGAQVTQKMGSTGIFSADTARIATKTIGTAAGKLTGQALGRLAASSGAVGAVISGGVEVIGSARKLAKGQISAKEFTVSVARETAGGGLSAAGGSLAATAVATGVATVAGASAPVWVPAAVGIGAAVAVGSAVKAGWDCLWKKKRRR